MTESIGFIGLGIMGRGMAANLLAKGADLTVWNRTASKTKPLENAGAKTASSPADLGGRCDIVFICVSDTPDVVDVVEGSDGLFEGCRDASLIVDMSTISPSVTADLAKKAERRGIHMLDAPVSGGSEGAEKGTLSIMVGGEEEQVARAKPYFEMMGGAITHVGGNGAGQSVKLVNQILVVVNMLAVSEALTFAESSGLDLRKTLAAVTEGAAGSWMLRNRGPQCIDDDWRPGFTIDLQQKDLRLVLEAADELSVPLLSTSTCFHLYRTLQRRGLGGEGNHALIKAIQKLVEA